MKTGKIRWFATILSVSALICFASMCFLVDNEQNYANAKDTYGKVVVSANAEISERLPEKEKTEFDDSVWGRLATFLQDMIEAWYP
jgi:alkyl sulfatase BDS1-like metallo-beta-lactamase superfamily hydrolase